MKASLLLLSVPLATALAFAPSGSQQDPRTTTATKAKDPVVAIESISAIQYLDLQGTKTNVPAHSVVEVRLFQDFRNHIRVELLYENGDYSLIDAQALHILRNGGGKRDVKFVRTIPSGMRFPKLP